MVIRWIDPGDFVPLFIFAIPIVAIAGGITAGIVRTLGQQRLIELAQRERIAAIERGVDPAKLPPLPTSLADDVPVYASFADVSRRRSQGLLIGGVVTLAVGFGLGIMLRLLSHDEDYAWAVGLIPARVGIALLVSAGIVHPKGNDAGSQGPPRVS